MKTRRRAVRPQALSPGLCTPPRCCSSLAVLWALGAIGAVGAVGTAPTSQVLVVVHAVASGKAEGGTGLYL